MAFNREFEAEVLPTQIYTVKVVDGNEYTDTMFKPAKGDAYQLPNHPDQLALAKQRIEAATGKPVDKLKIPVMAQFKVQVGLRADGTKDELFGRTFLTNPIEITLRERKNKYKPEFLLLVEGAGNDVETLRKTGFNVNNILIGREVKDVPVINYTDENGAQAAWISFKDWRTNQGWVNPNEGKSNQTSFAEAGFDNDEPVKKDEVKSFEEFLSGDSNANDSERFS